MNAATRRRTLAQMVRQRGPVPVAELAAELGCSEMTVRRDLNALEHDGVIRRVHGSAVAASAANSPGWQCRLSSWRT